MSTTADRNAEIWSTRLQREILALESSDDESKKIELLPPFITPMGHTLNIEGGIAKIEFRIDVDMPPTPENNADNAAKEEVIAAAKSEDGAVAVENAAEKKGKEGEGDSNENNGTAQDETTEDKKEEGEGNDNDDKESEPNEPPKKDDEVEVTQPEQDQEHIMADPHVILVIDASLYWRPDSASNNQSTTPESYPFQKPLAIIKSGSNLFCQESTIQNGDEIDIDLDWTPSIHLSDAVTNVSLKIRECIKRGEPLHPVLHDDSDDEGLSGSLLREARDAKESLLETKKAALTLFSSGLSSLSQKGSSIAARGQSASKSMLESLSTFPEALAKAAEGEEDSAIAAVGGGEEASTKAVKECPDVGDEIDLSDSPWDKCIGMYSCKAISRPEFVEAAMASATNKQKEASSAGSMFSRFAKSAKSAMEESFLMITDKAIIEFRSHRLNIGTGTVTFAIKIDQMAKLKFRREESLSLFFKPASDDPLVYMCLDSALAVQDIQNVLKRHGVKGKHTNAATQRAVQMALNLVSLIQQKEKELIDNPTVERVNEIMDLYRQAAEKFEVAGDPRHAEVMAHMKRFLNQQFTTSILDGTFGKSASDNTKSDAVPEGEVLAAPTYNPAIDDDDDEEETEEDKDTPTKDVPDDLNDTTLQNMEDMLNEAVQDMSATGFEDDDITDILTSPLKTSDGEKSDVDDLAEHDATFAELDAMLSDADAELNELLSS